MDLSDVPSTREEEKKPELAAALTAEDVQYASVACGALFRFCAALLLAASRMVEERDAAKAQEVPLQRQLDGLAGEKGAVLEYLAQLEREQQQLQAERERQRAALEERNACLAAAERRLQLARQGRVQERAARAAAVLRAEEDAERETAKELRRAERQRAKREQDMKASTLLRPHGHCIAPPLRGGGGGGERGW